MRVAWPPFVLYNLARTTQESSVELQQHTSEVNTRKQDRLCEAACFNFHAHMHRKGKSKGTRGECARY